MAETLEEPGTSTMDPKQDAFADLATESFRAVFEGVTVYFQLVKLNRSCFLWIGDDRKRMDCLSAAIPNPFGSVSLVTSIIDRRSTNSLAAARDEGQEIAMKLSKKLNAQVFVTFNVSAITEVDILPAIEAHLFGLVKNGMRLTL